MKNKILTICIILFTLTIGGCIVAEPHQEKKMDEVKESLSNKKWQLQQLGNSRRLVTNKAYIKFQDNGKVLGFSGCNRFQGKAKFNSKMLSIGPLGSTRKACPDVMAFEAKVLKMLRETNRYSIKNNQLELYNGKVRLGVFR